VDTTPDRVAMGAVEARFGDHIPTLGEVESTMTLMQSIMQITANPKLAARSAHAVSIVQLLWNITRGEA